MGRLDEFPIAENMLILQTCRGSTVDAGIGPGDVHIGVKSVRGPCALMIGMSVRVEITGIGNSNMAEKKNRLYVPRIGTVIRFDDALDAGNGCRACHIVTNHSPAI